MAPARTKSLGDQIRQAIDKSGLSRYNIAQATGIDESALGKFYHGERGLGLESLDRLVQYLRLELRPRKRKGR